MAGFYHFSTDIKGKKPKAKLPYSPAGICSPRDNRIPKPFKIRLGLVGGDPMIGGTTPMPMKFPMKFKECLRRIIGGRLYKTRVDFFTRYWCAMLKGYAELGSPPPYGDDNRTDEGRQKMADDMVAKFSNEGVDEYWFNTISTGFTEWRKQNKLQQRKDAANKRWKKEKSKKRRKNI